MKALFSALALLACTAPVALIHAGARPPVTSSDPARAIADLFVGGPYLNAPTEFQIRTIRKAQQNLRTLGLYNGPVNGQPSPDLGLALQRYQRTSGFRQTGRLDKVTLQGLDLLYTSWER